MAKKIKTYIKQIKEAPSRSSRLLTIRIPVGLYEELEPMLKAHDTSWRQVFEAALVQYKDETKGKR